jgi:hypothetical protein
MSSTSPLKGQTVWAVGESSHPTSPLFRWNTDSNVAPYTNSTWNVPVRSHGTVILTIPLTVLRMLWRLDPLTNTDFGAFIVTSSCSVRLFVRDVRMTTDSKFKNTKSSDKQNLKFEIQSMFKFHDSACDSSQFVLFQIPNSNFFNSSILYTFTFLFTIAEFIYRRFIYDA